MSPFASRARPWWPCEPSRRTQACRQAGERSSPDPGDSRDRAPPTRTHPPDAPHPPPAMGTGGRPPAPCWRRGCSRAVDRARRLAWCREVRRSDRVAEDKASGRDTRADLEGGSSNSPADRPGRSPRRAGSRGGGEGDDPLGSCRQREDVAAARLGQPSGSGAWARRPPGATRPARRPAVLAGPAGRGPSCLRHNQPSRTTNSDTRLQRAGDGRPSAIGARRCSRRHHVGHR